MKNLLTRLITGILYIAVIVAADMAGGWWFWGLGMLFTLLGINEFNRISNQSHVSNTTRLLDMIGGEMLVTAALAINAFSFTSGSFAHAGAVVGIYCLTLYPLYLLVRFISQLYLQDGNALQHYGNSMMGQVYIAFPMALMVALRSTTNEWVILAMFVLIWLSDTGAYCVGSLIGRHKLFERISPHKSWEGFFGGLAFCLIASVCMWYARPEWFNMFFSNPWKMLGWGAVVCVFGTWGDLMESLIKRTLHIKDSGSLLPGHGGILDRIDSLLLVVPATALYIILVILQ